MIFDVFQTRFENSQKKNASILVLYQNEKKFFFHCAKRVLP